MKIGMTGSFALVCLGGLVASAQVCQVTNSTLNGAYGYAAIQTAWTSNMQAVWTSNINGTSSGATGTTPGGTGSTSSSGYSTTGIGQLLGGIADNAPFSAVGRVTFDGAGNISATSTPTGGLTMIVGTYNINTDCTITAKLMDAFGTNSKATQLSGIVLSGGSEIELGLAPTTASTSTSSSGSSSSSSSPSGSSSTTSSSSSTRYGPVIRLTKLLATSGCNVANITGVYGLVLNGVSISSSTSSSESSGSGGSGASPLTSAEVGSSGSSNTGSGTTLMALPLSIIGRVQFDGAGNLVPNSAASTSAPGLSQFTGTYTVNSDCTGSMTLSTSSSSSSTSSSTSGASTSSSTTTPPMTVNFVLTAPKIVVNQGNNNLGSYQLHPGIDGGVSSSTEAASGQASAQ